MTRGGVNMKLWRQIGKICLNCRKLRIVLSIENRLCARHYFVNYFNRFIFVEIHPVSLRI